MNQEASSKIENRIGFIQGRLSELVNNRIQLFPVKSWKAELKEASRNEIRTLEWTIDSETITENPLILPESIPEVIENINYFNIRIPSVTCDYFMEKPPWQESARDLEDILTKIMIGMRLLNSTKLVIPLVDNSSLSENRYKTSIINFFEQMNAKIIENNIQICFESDFSPKNLADFIDEFPSYNYGINYDIGNSASLGYLPHEEFEMYGNRIINVHVKDRLLHGKSVPLGEGSADFETVFKCLKSIKYDGNYILQTARDATGNHLSALLKYRSMVVNWINNYE
jgi:hexulose-6-phosphate isomerase